MVLLGEFQTMRNVMYDELVGEACAQRVYIYIYIYIVKFDLNLSNYINNIHILSFRVFNLTHIIIMVYFVCSLIYQMFVNWEYVAKQTNLY